MRMSTRFSEFGVYSRSTTPSNFRKAAITFKASSSNDGPRGRAGTAKTDIIFYYYIMLHGSPLDCAEGSWFRIVLLAVLSPRTVCNYFHTCQIPKKNVDFKSERGDQPWTRARIMERVVYGPKPLYLKLLGCLWHAYLLDLLRSLVLIGPYQNLVKPSDRHWRRMVQPCSPFQETTKPHLQASFFAPPPGSSKRAVLAPTWRLRWVSAQKTSTHARQMPQTRKIKRWFLW